MAELAITQGCFFSTVKNTSGETRFFGFLPPHGVTLEDDAELNVFGDLPSVVWQATHSYRSQDALNNAVEAGDLTVKSTTCVIVYDATDLTSYRVGSDDGDLGVTTPRWDSFNPYVA